ncbi:c-type cytochrome [Rhizorhabdus argentea]|uniref:c-type cytochrome n=1 Tax=Rhizorhabdus argentea TaxID=1387174 RepID=UPI0030EF6F23
MRRWYSSAVLLGFAALLLIGIAGGYLYNYAKARAQLAEKASLLTGGNPAHGKALVAAFGCGACHSIPGVPQADAMVGPPLSGIATRVYIAGRLENRPGNLIRWIENPRAIDPQTVMPPLGVREAQARDIAAFLYTLD